MLLHSKERQLLELCTALRVTEKETDDLMITGRVFIGNPKHYNDQGFEV